MNKSDSYQILKFILFSIPACIPLFLIFVVAVIWKEGFGQPDLVPVIWLVIFIVAVSILLVKNHWWISIPMILAGAYIFIALGNEQHFGGAFQHYAAYLMLHYSVCGIYVFRRKKYTV